MKTNDAFWLVLMLSMAFCSLSCAGYEVTGREFGRKAESAMINDDDALLWQAYATKSDSLLQLFFDRWQDSSYPDSDLQQDYPYADAVASLLHDILLERAGDTRSRDQYLILRDSIDIAVYDSVEATDRFDRIDVRTLLPSPDQFERERLVVLDEPRAEMLLRFLGVPSDAKEAAARQFFGDRISFRSDMNGEQLGWSWCIPEIRWMFDLSPDLLGAHVIDSTCHGRRTAQYEYRDGSWRRWHEPPIPTSILIGR